MSHYLAFVAVITVLVLIPGPAVILVMKKAITTGARGALRVAAGVLTADLVWAAAAAAGVSAVIAASQPAFLALRIAGAAYLPHLPRRTPAAGPEGQAAAGRARPGRGRNRGSGSTLAGLPSGVPLRHD